MIIFSYLSFFRFGFQGSIEIEFDDERVEEFRRKCRLLTRCGDPKNQDCFQFYGNLPNDQQPAQCNPRSNYDFYETKWIYDVLILIAQGVFFRIIALIFAYSITRQRKDLNYEIPGDIKEEIEQRKAAVYG